MPTDPNLGPAIEVLTAWLDSSSDTSWAASIAGNAMTGSVESQVSFVISLLNVSSWLLLRTAQATGMTEVEILQDLALRGSKPWD